MSDFLQAISTVSVHRDEQPALVERVPLKAQSLSPASAPTALTVHEVKGPEDVLSNLQNQPSESHALQQLHWLIKHSSPTFNIRIPSTQSSSILRTILSLTIPDLWLSSEAAKEAICQCLTSLPGIRGLLSKLDSVAATASGSASANSALAGSQVFLDVLQNVLSQSSVIALVWTQHAAIGNDGQRRLFWRDFTNVMTSGKIVSTVARYQDATSSDERFWMASGQEYTSRFARWIFVLASALAAEDPAGWKAAADLLSKAFALGYSTILVESFCHASLVDAGTGVPIAAKVFQEFPALAQKRLLDYLLPILPRVLALSSGSDATIVRISAFIAGIIPAGSSLWNELVSWTQRPAATQTITRDTRRSVLAVISSNTDDMFTILDRNMQVFGENLFIRHAPSLEQEACGEVILLCAAHLQVRDSTRLKTLAHSSVHMNGVSNRLNSSLQRARTLGMCVGMAMSKLVDGPSTQMKFDVEDVKTPFAFQFMALADSRDRAGGPEDLTDIQSRFKKSEVKTPPKATTKPPSTISKTRPVITEVTGPRIVEVLSDDEDEDIIAYDKPDSDPEDEDDDPSLVNRDKQKAPVYIRDLMSGLREDEKYDRFKLSLESAANLIRRKAQFGKEVKDHAIELSTILIGLQDTFELEGFVELRLQALIAVLLSDPVELGPWFARQVFEGDYSLSQRGTVLSAIGLAGRELAGFKDSDALNPSVVDNQLFPSERLPDKYHAIYSTTPHTALPLTPLNTISTSLTDSIIAPLAAEAADSATGPSALKVRTFSSRLTTPARTKVIPNALASILSDALITPLAGHFYTHTNSRRESVFATPFFLSTYLTTLVVLLHASGPATRSLPQLTADLWALLLSARRAAAEYEASVLRALLFGFLTLLEVNADDTRRLATEHGRQLAETQAWVRDVYGRLAGGDDEADKLRGLAAAVLVKCGEVMEKWQRLLVGDVMDY